MALRPPDQASAEPRRWDSIEALFEALESPLLAYALRLAGDSNVAEDIVQDAFMRLHAQFNEVREPQRWLYRTVHNLALNHRRQASRIVPLIAPGADNTAGTSEPHSAASAGDTADPQPLPDEQIARLEGIGLVRLSLETLDVRSRELVRLKFNEELSYKEISARTGLNIGHVGYLLHHALKAIADELARNGVVP
ncbi:MAG TPA: RNA polymerase sigma factor [Candidatus Acidoferrum sp.]|nr:RNA polymerase sigma factor [Candidatus Acidoferrum sp.]